MQDFYNALQSKTTFDVFNFDLTSDEENSLDRDLKFKGYSIPTYKHFSKYSK